MWNAAYSIPLGTKYHATLTPQAKPNQSEEIERDVHRQEDPKEDARHIFDKDPYQVAMPVIDLRITVPPDKCRAYVLDGCLGDVQRPMTRKTQPKAKVHIFYIEEKFLIQQANRL